jgi:flavin-dependent dehydrogenase
MIGAESSTADNFCDVLVVGGALSGAATALLLKRRVGEATVEVSGYFLCRVLGLTNFLTQNQLTKNGLRFWFSNDQCQTMGDCSEIGGRYLSTVPSFLVDRAVLDEEILSRATSSGVKVLRPATVKSVKLNPGSY